MVSDGDLVIRLVAFGRTLQAEGLTVTPGRVIDAARSLELLDASDRAAFRAALRANLTISVDDFPAFDRAFAAFWLGQGAARAAQPIAATTIGNRPEGPPLYALARVALEGMAPDGDARLPGGDHSAGETEILTRKDFRDYSAGDLGRARRLVRELRPALATARSRRWQPAAGGSDVDIRRTVRLARRQGEVVELAKRRAKRRKLKVVALCDVSGSMDLYANHLLQFFAALQAESGGVHTFVFSTRLQDVTAVLRRRRYDEVLAGLGATVEAWSGGTTIGACLAEFNRRYGKTLVGPRTVVIIASDGWERGDPAVLRHEMRGLRERARQIIWLNPLKAREGYEPLAAGMAAALPFVDHFLPANSMASLARLKRLLARA